MYKCSSCGAIKAEIKYHCVQCVRCSECCECTLIKFFDNDPKFHKAANKQRVVNKSDRFISAEIEVAGVKNSANLQELVNVVNKWQGSAVYDGSLPLCGFEINTSPSSGDLFVNQINAITTAIAATDPMLLPECGLHIHTDARDFGYFDIVRLMRLYDIIEDALFDMVPANRRKSRFCLPCGDKYMKAVKGVKKPANFSAVKSNIAISIYGDPFVDTHRQSKRNDAKYNALNLHSWYYRGTIEHRLPEGTYDAQTIILWGMLWANLLDIVREMSDTALDKLARRSSEKALLKVVDSNSELVEFVKKRIKANKVKPKKKAKKR